MLGLWCGQWRVLWLRLLCAVPLAGCATSIELEPNQAYVLSRVGYSAGYPIRGLEFRNVDTGEDVLVKPGRAILTRVVPGRYYMRRINDLFDNVRGEPMQQPAGLIRVEAGKINYIGSWGIFVTGETEARIMLAPQHDYPPDVIDEGKKAAGRVFALYPVVEARLRASEAPLRTRPEAM